MCHNIGCLDPQDFKEFKLVKRTQLSHNVAKFKFALPTPTSVLGLPIGQHMSCRFLFHGFVFFTYPHHRTKPICILIFNCTRLVSFFMVYHGFFFLLFIACFYRGKDSLGDEVVKPYTPTTLDSDVGYFELVIKVHVLCNIPFSNLLLFMNIIIIIFYCLY